MGRMTPAYSEGPRGARSSARGLTAILKLGTGMPGKLTTNIEWSFEPQRRRQAPADCPRSIGDVAILAPPPEQHRQPRAHTAHVEGAAPAWTKLDAVSAAT
jgi:hypothetical protein